MRKRNEMNEFDTRTLGAGKSEYSRILAENEAEKRRGIRGGKRPRRKKSSTDTVYADSMVHTYFRSNAVALAAISLFIIPILFLGIYSLVDVDKTVSETEKRNLKTKPDFSFSALFSGKYPKEFEEYYSDTFPFRDFFLKVNNKLEAKLTQMEGSDGVIIQGPNNPDDFNGEAITNPDDTHSQTDPSADKSSESSESSESKDNMEDHDFAVSSNRYVILDKTRKSAMELYSVNPGKIKEYASVLNQFAEKVPEAKMYSLLAPMSVEFYGSSKYNSGGQSQKKGIDMAYEAMSDKITKVDAYSALSAHVDEYIYFRTDHHWTARGAYYGYTAFAKAAGITPKPLSSYQSGKIDGFVGSLYGYTQSDMLKNNPDYVEYFLPQTPAVGNYYYTPDLANPIPLKIVATEVPGSNKYLAFIQGDTPVAKITTDNKNGKKVIVVKESYGNAFVPFLIENYEEIYVTDPRKIDMNLPAFVKEHGINDVVMINYTQAPYNSGYMSSLKKMTGYVG